MNLEAIFIKMINNLKVHSRIDEHVWEIQLDFPREEYKSLLHFVNSKVKKSICYVFKTKYGTFIYNTVAFYGCSDDIESNNVIWVHFPEKSVKPEDIVDDFI